MSKSRKQLLKNFRLKQVAGEGKVTAVLATLNQVDKDGDLTLPGAFGQQQAPIMPAHDWMSVPLGKASIRETDDEALVDLNFNLEVDAGRDWYNALKFDFENGEPLQQYSYGYDILEADQEERDGVKVQLLKSVKVHEVSPVLLGAGVATRTLAVKRSMEKEHQAAEGSLADVSAYLDRVKALAALRAKEGRTLSAANRERLERLLGVIAEVGKDIRKFLDDTDPDAKAKVDAAFLAYQHKRSVLEPLLRT